MNYRILPAAEWDRLRALIEPQFLPGPEVATAVIAEDDGEIEGVLFLQLQLHLEPLYIRNPRVSFLRLTAKIEEALAERKGLVYFAFTDDSKVERMAELAGMTRTSYTVWRKEVV